MSNALAITAVTMTLQSVLMREFATPVLLPVDNTLAGTSVSVRPPDRASDEAAGNRLNLFLFQTQINAALRNSELAPLRPGQGFPPLALNLSYLLTAYGPQNDQNGDLIAQRILGRAMSVLHDTPILLPAQIRDATSTISPAGDPFVSDLHEQIEHVRITSMPMTIEDMARLWTTFQTQYRISATYHVAVVLIESARRPRSALPVLRRGPEDRGPLVQSDTIPPFPTLESLSEPPRRPALQFGDKLTLTGHHLIGTDQRLIFTNQRMEMSNELEPLANGTATSLQVQLPAENDAAAAPKWPPGLYSLALQVDQGGRTRLSNGLPLLLAPVISAPQDLVRRDGTSTFVTIDCAPQIWPQQRVSLLIGDREVVANARENKLSSIEFEVKDLAAGSYVVRLRVDGVDSMPFVEAGDPPRLAFANNQRVVIP
jgi:hypothetical protein